MKKHIFLFLGIISLTACATFQQQAFDWRGQNFDNYILSRGLPTSKYSLQNGNMVYSFKKACQYDSMQTEEILVTVGEDNLITNISTPTRCLSYYDSPQYQLDQIAYELQQEQNRRELELRQKEQERKEEIEYIGNRLHIIGVEASIQELAVQQAQIELDIAQRRGNETAVEEYTQKLNNERAKLEQFEQEKINLENKRELLQ